MGGNICEIIIHDVCYYFFLAYYFIVFNKRFLLLKFFVKTEIGQRNRISKIQDMFANSNEGMVFTLVVSLEQGGKNEPLESPSRLGLICFKTFDLNLI